MTHTPLLSQKLAIIIFFDESGGCKPRHIEEVLLFYSLDSCAIADHANDLYKFNWLLKLLLIEII